ncbi:hypothetical protein [Mongoliitalea lutea]|uniref:DUF4142 domain-containing protein n=1 Tax=Mongoliitalea lutea TaxID=849756 RepID=A0A8J3CTW5_9BACT|nr:hypothetical protein [Mongoliitalea lutea]GHB25557.1 hypothetical protein GCM10008106_02910 [Mongoliitalea lutea]
MKQILFSLTFICILLFTNGATAQRLKLPSGSGDLTNQVLSAINTVDKLGLTADQDTKLKAHNKSFVDDVFKVLNNSSLSDDAKKSSFTNLKMTRQNFLLQLLGQQLLGNYNKGVGNLLKPLNKQLGLAALAF